jgi:F0F1-type ATP synthase assembly protein I
MKRIENFLQFVLLGVFVGIILDHVPPVTPQQVSPSVQQVSI